MAPSAFWDTQARACDDVFGPHTILSKRRTRNAGTRKVACRCARPLTGARTLAGTSGLLQGRPRECRRRRPAPWEDAGRWGPRGSSNVRLSSRGLPRGSWPGRRGGAGGHLCSRGGWWRRDWEAPSLLVKGRSGVFGAQRRILGVLSQAGPSPW